MVNKKRFMVVTNKQNSNLKIKYKVESIECIKYGPAIEFHTIEDCAGNGVDQDEFTMLVMFKDGTMSTFIQDNWDVTFTFVDEVDECDIY